MQFPTRRWEPHGFAECTQSGKASRDSLRNVVLLHSLTEQSQEALYKSLQGQCGINRISALVRNDLMALLV